ncbi:uncharacterized protein LOC106181068 [Lingula anatina]|uniref:Uncharacterized protein LOC106181068 n=1 Tax=Lingula anatina TaxID=7574 RepID=A0A1S3KE57_LINAN|nr:uncharacterized protein LOC106181068 [Lingula anatina]XP_013420782.1 uncharacterized protein LOC106181068 [Lingula anatina]|eukprot:XP_013420781.1 uncharacterized protein LOC106181068 [Lingula anatina]
MDHKPGDRRRANTFPVPTESEPVPTVPGFEEILKELARNGPNYDFSAPCNTPANPQEGLPENYQSWSTVTDDSPRGNFGFTASGGLDWDFLSQNDSFNQAANTASPSNFASYEDFLASLSQTSHSEAMPEVSSDQGFYGFYGTLDGLGSGTDFLPDAVQEGRDLYASALHQWNATAAATSQQPRSTYDPFGTSPILGSDGLGRMSPVASAGSPTHSSTKPTYSDVAKNKAPGPAPLKHRRSEPVMTPARDTEPSVPPPGFRRAKPRPFFPTTKFKVGSVDNKSAPSPDSKYGLDSFQVPPSLVKEVATDSVSSSRKGSSSSQASTTSGLDDITLGKPFQNGRTDTGTKEDQRDTGGKSKRPGGKDKKEERQGRGKQNSLVSVNSIDKEETLLNNRASTTPSTGHGPKTSSTYINNDLRNWSDSKKQKNASTSYNETESSSPSETTRTGGGSRKSGTSSKNNVNNENTGRKNRKQKKEHNPIGDWLGKGFELGKWAVTEALLWVLVALMVLFRLVWLIVSNVSFYVSVVYTCIWTFVTNKVKKRWKWWGRGQDGTSQSHTHIGLEENIQLPTTGEEAMKRLLACKGKDPYSILGLRSDVSDDEVKKYYKRQAILVHPDKNKQLGAEEAFKILGHAFEIIGEPERRKAYNDQTIKSKEMEAAMKEFTDLLSKLHEKMEEAANLMRCDHCGGKHRRYPVNRPWYSARYCDRCQAHHSVKEGDVWAETTWLGFKWHYYACMEGAVYNITDWAAHQMDHFKHIQANAHHVFYKLQTGANRQQTASVGNTGEAELEDFLNHLFHKTSGGRDVPKPSGSQNSNQAQQPDVNTYKKKKRKRKH